MSWTRDLAYGLAGHLAANGIGTWTPNDPIDGQAHPIVYGALPPDTGGIGLAPYNLQADPTLADAVQPIQIYLRGDPGWVDDTADAIFNLLHGVGQFTLGGIPCELITLNSDVPMGLDMSGRQERALNYYLAASRPTPARPD